MKRPTFLRIPCGKVLGHGESCVEGRMCIQCEYIEGIEKENEELKAHKAGKFENEDGMNTLKVFISPLTKTDEVVFTIIDNKELLIRDTKPLDDVLRGIKGLITSKQEE